MRKMTYVFPALSFNPISRWNLKEWKFSRYKTSCRTTNYKKNCYDNSMVGISEFAWTSSWYDPGDWNFRIQIKWVWIVAIVDVLDKSCRPRWEKILPICFTIGGILRGKCLQKIPKYFASVQQYNRFEEAFVSLALLFNIYISLKNCHSEIFSF